MKKITKQQLIDQIYMALIDLSEDRQERSGRNDYLKTSDCDNVSKDIVRLISERELSFLFE